MPDRILLLAPQPFYQDRGTPIAVAHVLDVLSRRGVEVDVLTFPVGRDIVLPGVRIVRAGPSLGIRHVPVGLSAGKVIFDVLLAMRAWRMCATRRYAAVYAVEEAMFAALLLGRRFRLPLIYDMQSSIPDQLTGHWLFGWRPLQEFLRALELRFIRTARVTACSAGLDTLVRARFPDAAVEVWRYPATQPVVPPDTAQRLRFALDIPESARVVYYGGNFAEYQGLDTLLAAIPRVLAAAPDTVFVLVGAVESDRLHERIPAGASRKACRVVPRVTVSEVPHYLALADVAVSPRSSGQNLPLKIIDYMASGKPIVATDRPAHREALDEDVAVLVENTPGALSDGIISLLGDRDRAARLGAAARRRAELEFGLAAFEMQVCRILGRIERPQGQPRAVPDEHRQ